MNKGGVGGGSGGGGPTASAAAAAAQKQKTLLQRVDNDIGSIVDNFSFLVNVARVLTLSVYSCIPCWFFFVYCKANICGLKHFFNGMVDRLCYLCQRWTSLGSRLIVFPVRGVL